MLCKIIYNHFDIINQLLVISTKPLVFETLSGIKQVRCLIRITAT